MNERRAGVGISERVPRETGAAEWTRLFLEKIEPNSRPVTAIDPQLSQLVNDASVGWYDALDFLKDQFREHSRELYDGSDTSGFTVTTSATKSNIRRHLVIFNPENNDYLLHFTLTLDSEPELPFGHVESNEPDSLHNKILAGITDPIWTRLTLQIFAVSREGFSNECEYQHIDQIIQTLCCWLWNQSRKSVEL